MSWMQWHIFNWPLHSCFVVLLRLQKALLSIVLKGCEPFTELEECFIAHTPQAKAVKSLLLAQAGPVMQEMRGREWEKDKGRCKREAKKEAGRGIQHQFSFLIAYPLSSLFLINSHRSAYREQIYVRCVIYEILCGIGRPSWLSYPRSRRRRLQSRWPVSRRRRASWTQRYPSGMTAEMTSSFWPSKCAWSWWRWQTSPGELKLPSSLLECLSKTTQTHIHLSFRFNSIDLSGHALLLRFHCVLAQCFSFILVCMAVCIGNEMCTSLFRGKSFPILKERLVKSVIFFIPNFPCHLPKSAIN